MKIVQEAGMYLILRIGPFVAAEWNFGCVIVIFAMIFFFVLERPMVGEVVYVKEKSGSIMDLG